MNKMSEQLKWMAVAQSASQITYSLGEMTGVTNALLLAEQEPRTLGKRLQMIAKQLEKEVANIEFIISQGHAPTSARERELGAKVQAAVNEISQI